MIKYKNWGMFFDIPDDAGGLEEQETPNADAVFDTPAEKKVEETIAEELQAPPTSQTDWTAFAKTLGTELAAVLPKEAPKEEPKLTVEEAEKALNIWKPTPEWFKKLDNLETREEALREQRDGFTKQYDTLMQYRLREMEQKFTSQLNPLLQAQQVQTAIAQEGRLHTAFPDLAKPEMAPLYRAVAQDFASKKQTFPDEAALFKALANGVEAIIKTQNPNFKLATGSNPADTTTKPTGKIPVTTPGAGGGVGNSKVAPAKKAGLAVFD